MRNQNTRADKSIKIYKKKYGDFFKEKEKFLSRFKKKTSIKYVSRKKSLTYFNKKKTLIFYEDASGKVLFSCDVINVIVT